MSIMITGANGQLGKFIIKHLLQKVAASSIVACVRQPDKATEFADQGIEVRYCDYDRPESLEPAFTGASKLLLISSSHTDDTTRIRQHAHAIEAAKKANVGHLLYTGFAYPEKGSVSLTHLHLATEYAIRTTGLPYTFFRNALYTDFIASLGLSEAIANGELVTYPGEWRFNTVTRSDLAMGIAAVLAEQGHENRTYELTASRSWNFSELAQILSELAGKPIAHREDPSVKSWIYGFLARIDTSSTSPDLEKLNGGTWVPLKEAVGNMLKKQ